MSLAATATPSHRYLPLSRVVSRILADAFRAPALSLAIVVAIVLIVGGVGLALGPAVVVANDEDCGGRASGQIVSVAPWGEIG